MPCYHCTGWWWWWCNGVGDVFLAHFRPLSANWASFECHSLPEHCFWPYVSLYGHHVPILWWLLPAGQCTMSQSSNHFKLVSWTSQWVHCPKMAPTVTRSQPNRASLGCGGTGMCIPQISINCKILSYQYGPTFPKNAFSALLNQCHAELREFWRRKGARHIISMVCS